MDKVLFSHKNDVWSTPQYLFDKLDSEFHFEIDACANSDNAKCATYFSPEIDALSCSWEGTIFCNPPYSKIKQFVKHAFNQWSLGRCTVVLLLPSRTDTSWFHDYLLSNAEIRFLRGRLKFSESKNSAPFPSMICILKKKSEDINNIK